MDSNYNSDRHKRLCLHEAGHFIFALLLKGIYDNSEEITEITVDEEKEWFRVHLIPGKGNNPRSFYSNYNELIKIRSQHAIADIILHLSGSSTHIAYLGKEDPYYPITKLNQHHETLIQIGDFYNARLIGYEFFRDMDNTTFYSFAHSIQDIIIKIMKETVIKNAIFKVAECIAKRKTIDHTELNEFESEVENLLLGYDIKKPFSEILNKYKYYHPISSIKRELQQEN